VKDGPMKPTRSTVPAALALAAAIAACSKSAPEPGTAPEATSAPSPAPAPTPTAESLPRSAGSRLPPDLSLKPCTGKGDPPNCVKCNGNAAGKCSATEAFFVERDIQKGNLSGGQEDLTSCYGCLWNAGCIDDTVNVDKGKECEDFAGPVGTGAKATESKTMACLDVVKCALDTGCHNAKAQGATDGISNCYCGANDRNTMACMAHTGGLPNGSCLQAELDGLGFTSDATSQAVLGTFTRRTTAAGMANAIFQCAGSNAGKFTCPTCFL
ncbi:MAG: hypothetical protein ACRENE_10805, partial [Polyangiaceae bacterium]